MAIVVGGIFGYVNPPAAVKLKPLGDGFIALVKMLIGPVIFFTVVLGIVGAGDMKKVGRVGGNALIYFEMVSNISAADRAHCRECGASRRRIQRRSAHAGCESRGCLRQNGRGAATTDFLLHLIPKTFIDAFTGSGDLLQVLLIAILFGYAMSRLGAAARPCTPLLKIVSRIFFAMMNVIMKLAPLGAGGAMAFTIGNYGLAALKPLAILMASFYLTCALFIFVVLGGIAGYSDSVSGDSSGTSGTRS